MRLFSAPLIIGVDNVPETFQVELLELQGKDTSEHNSHESSLLDVYKPLPEDEFPQLVEFSKKKVSLFGSTFKCEQLFSRMKYTTLETRSRFTDFRLQK
jgi:hypothetical protein